MPEVIVIGAGAAGFSAALELADRGYQVKLIEQATLGSGASGSNPGRMGHGFHYVDVDTAKMYLRASVQVQRKYPDYLIGKEHPLDHPLRRARYFITKQSDNTPELILASYLQIKEEYSRLIKEDPENEVFGPEENFLRVLELAEYESQVNTDLVVMGIETAEHLFHWHAFAKDIKDKIHANKNIVLYEHTEVVRIERGELNEDRFSIHVKEKHSSSETERVFHTNYLVNSTWQNIEFFNNQLGLPMIPSTRTNRLKALLVAKLPESLTHTHSMFFCMGQHCMFSNLGNGYGMMTFANVTNMETSLGLTLSDYAKRLIKGDATPAEKKLISKDILAGVAKYIPEMKHATIIDVKFGIVRTAGTLSLSDLSDPLSSFHKRNYYGISEEQIGLVSNPCTKLFYFVRNGNLVADWIDAEVIATSVIKKCMRDIETYAKKINFSLTVDIKKTLMGTMERQFTSTDKYITSENGESISTVMFETMVKKKAVLNELKDKAEKNQHTNKAEWVSPGFFMQLRSISIELIALLLLAISLTTLIVAGGMASAPIAIAGGVTAGVALSIYAGNFFFAKNKLNSEASNNRCDAIALDSLEGHIGPSWVSC